MKHFDISGGFLDQIRFKNSRICLEKITVKAVNDVSLFIKKGETLSVVGESGCGKSTLARVIMGLYPPNAGEVYYGGKRIDNLSHDQMLLFRKKMQMIFQDPYASLNPRKTVQQTLEEPLRFHHPEFIVADEPVSALDVSIQAQILNLLMKAGRERDLTYLFITHDLSVVRHISTRVAVMYLGTVCELARAEDLFASPCHPYTKALLSAIPVVGEKRPKQIKLKGEVPTPGQFANRMCIPC